MKQDCSKCLINAICVYAWQTNDICIISRLPASIKVQMIENQVVCKQVMDYIKDIIVLKDKVPSDDYYERLDEEDRLYPDCRSCKNWQFEIHHYYNKKAIYICKKAHIIAVNSRLDRFNHCWEGEGQSPNIQLCTKKLLKKYQDKLVYNSSDLGELGKYIKIDYAQSIIEECINEMLAKPIQFDTTA